MMPLGIKPCFPKPWLLRVDACFKIQGALVRLHPACVRAGLRGQVRGRPPVSEGLPGVQLAVLPRAKPRDLADLKCIAERAFAKERCADAQVDDEESENQTIAVAGGSQAGMWRAKDSEASREAGRAR